MSNFLETEFDLLVIGTGLTESIVAAAASRIGKSVLHIDPNEFYGGYWASFNLSSLRSFVEGFNNKDCEESGGSSSDFAKVLNRLDNVKEYWRDCAEETDEIKEAVLNDSRRFNIDLVPKLLFSRGSLVELLISSNISRYAEFRAVDHVLTSFESVLKIVPSSRSDVFNSKELTVVEKRLLMKLLSKCLALEEASDEWKSNETSKFIDYLKANNLTAKLIHYILYAIAMGDEHTTFKVGIESTKKFLLCLGRYGNSPFLFPMYGCGEIPQCFCRLCAVFGGTYCLKWGVEAINYNDVNGEKVFTGVKCAEQTLTAKNVLVGPGIIATSEIFTDEVAAVTTDNSLKCGNISRCILITARPIGDAAMNEGGGGVSFMKCDEAFVVQLSHLSGTCPKGYYLIHITMHTNDTAETDTKPIIQQLFTDSNEIIYSLYFNIPMCLKCKHQKRTPSGVHLACGPSFELDYDMTIDEARRLFKTIYSEDEFLPRAPDPEEIIIGDEADDGEICETTITADSVDIVTKDVEAVNIDDGVAAEVDSVLSKGDE